MAKTIRGMIISFLTAFFTNWMEDVLILSGIILVVVNTYLISVVQTNILAGNYLTGVVLTLMGVVWAKRG